MTCPLPGAFHWGTRSLFSHATPSGSLFWLVACSFCLSPYPPANIDSCQQLLHLDLTSEWSWKCISFLVPVRGIKMKTDWFLANMRVTERNKVQITGHLESGWWKKLCIIWNDSKPAKDVSMILFNCCRLVEAISGLLGGCGLLTAG